MPYPNEHACRLLQPSQFKEKGWGRKSREHNGKSYDIIFGVDKSDDKSKEQAYRYPKDTWDVDEARTHCKDHNGTFEPAEAEAGRIEIVLKSGKFEGIGDEGTRFKKELIRVGKFTHPQFPSEKFSITKALMQKWIDNFELFKERGGKIPVPLRHTDEPDRNAGWLESLSIEEDKLFGILNITEPEIAKKIENKTIQDVSVSIGKDFQDENGKKYDEFLFHIALTTIPHIRGQEAFVKLEAGYENIEEDKSSDDLTSKQKQTDTDVNKGGGKMDYLKLAQEKVKAGKQAELTLEESQALLSFEQSEKKRVEGELETAKKTVNPDTTKLATLEAEGKKNEKKIADLEADLLARNKATVTIRVEKLCEAGILLPANKDKLIALAISKEAQSSTIELETEIVKEDKTTEKKTEKLSLVDAMFTILEGTPQYIGFAEKTVMTQKDPEKKDELNAEQKGQISESVANTRGAAKSLEEAKAKKS
jgi:hypothetical protein